MYHPRFHLEQKDIVVPTGSITSNLDCRKYEFTGSGRKDYGTLVFVRHTMTRRKLGRTEDTESDSCFYKYRRNTVA